MSELVLVIKGEGLLKMQIRTLLCRTGTLLVVFSKLFLEPTECNRTVKEFLSKGP